MKKILKISKKTENFLWNYTKFGIIYLPEKEELYYAAENQGVYLNNKKLEKPVILPIHDAVIEFGGSIANGYEIKEKCLERLLKDDIDRVSNILYIKSCCTAYTNLLTNKTSALITAATSPWDVMPGELMCRELGIEITYLDKDKRVKLFSNNQEIVFPGHHLILIVFRLHSMLDKVDLQ